jgi:hypothetical protein
MLDSSHLDARAAPRTDHTTYRCDSALCKILAKRPGDDRPILGQVSEAPAGAVDIVDLYELPEPITGKAMQGVRLVGTDEANARLLPRHLLNVADFLPLRQRLLDERRPAAGRVSGQREIVRSYEAGAADVAGRQRFHAVSGTMTNFGPRRTL